MKKNIFEMSPEDRDVVKGFLSEVQSAKTLQEQKNVLDSEFTGRIKDVTDIIKTTIFTKNNQFNIVDRDAIMEMISNLNSEVYDHEYILANNPIPKIFGAFLNNSNLGQDDDINRAIRAKFINAPMNITADELYHSGSKYKDASGKSFKDIIDAMHASTNEDGSIKYGDLDGYRDFIRSVLKDSGFKKKTDRSEDITDILINGEIKDGKRTYRGALDDGDLIRQFKDIANRVRSEKDINLKIEEKPWEDNGKKGISKNIVKQGYQYNERVLQLDEMAKTMDVLFIRGIDGK